MLTCRRPKPLRAANMQKISAYILTYNEAEKIEAACRACYGPTKWWWSIRSASTAPPRSPARSAPAWCKCRSTVSAICATRRSRPAVRVDLQPGCRRALHRSGARRNFGVDRRLAAARRLSGAPPQLHDGPLDPGSGWYPNFRQPQLFRKGSMRYTLEPVHEGYESRPGRRQITKCGLAVPIPQSRRGHQQDEPLFVARRAKARAQTGVDGERARPRTVVVPQALYIQARLHRRLGRLCHRLGEFRGHFYRYAKRYEQAQGWSRRRASTMRRETSP